MAVSKKKIVSGALPVVPIRDGIVFPGTENVLVFGRSKSVEAINEAMKEHKEVILLMQKNANQDNPSSKDLFPIGVIAHVEKTAVGEKGDVTCLVKGLQKVILTDVIQEEPYIIGNFDMLVEDATDNDEIQAMVKYISTQIKKAINLGKTIDFVFLMNILNIATPLDFARHVAMVLDIKAEERQILLEEGDLTKRLIKEIEYVNKEIKILELEHNISSKTQQKFERNMKESFLREKMKTIEEELGGKNDESDIKDYYKKIKEAKMPEEVEKKAIKELQKLKQMSQYNPEASYIRTYIEWLIDVPWNASSEHNGNLTDAETVLNEDHYGLKKIKERILEYLAVMELRRRREEISAKETTPKEAKVKKLAETEQKSLIRREKPPAILCFVGPPGVGKTSLGRSIARALGRKFVKMSLGGIRDEAEIRGHRRTYVGAMPGRIIQGIRQAKSNNPVFMLDEIDKIGRDYRGDPSSALLEALDPEQNHEFSDHYLEVPFDLSNAFFITTANVLDTIPDALLDRLEVIHFAGYTEEEKFHISKNYLVKKQAGANSLQPKEFVLSDKTIRTIIRRYTREAGVRELERQVSTVARKIARELVEGKDIPKNVTEKDLHKYLGAFKYSSSIIEEKDTVGITTGLAWTQAGGDILFIEVAIMPGKGNLTLTGQLGDVMKESCQAAFSYIRARWATFGLPTDFFNDIDIHVHVPEGAVPKDGPSAGTAITNAMVSALTRIPVRRDVAMTGEMTLRGRVLEVGGVKEKILAAHRSGIKKVILPKDNEKDLEDVPAEVIEDLKFVFVEHMDDVLEETLVYPTKNVSFPAVAWDMYHVEERKEEERKVN